MNNLKNQLIASLLQHDAKYIGSTVCYNIHEFKAKGKNSNLAKLVNSLPLPLVGRGYLVVVGSKGRTAHRFACI